MSSASSPIGSVLSRKLRDIGQRLRARRKRLRISATTTAEAAGMSRVTLYRIEKGEPSVAMGAYLSAVSALGLEIELRDPSANRKKPKLPSAIRLADYPQLKRLAWQLRPMKEISPKEALDLYERNWRHVEPDSMDASERTLVDSLLKAFGRERMLV